MGQSMSFEKWYKTAKEKIGFPACAESLELSLREVVGEVLSQNLKLKTENKKLKAQLKDFDKLKEEKEKLSGRLSEAVEIIKEYVKISLTEPETRSMIEEVELFKKAQEFLSEIEE